MGGTTYTPIGNDWYAKNSNEARERMQLEKEYFEIMRESIPFMKRFKASKEASVGQEKHSIDVRDMVRIMKKDDMVLSSEAKALSDEYDYGYSDGKVEGVVVGYKIATKSMKNVLVASILGLAIGLSAYGINAVNNIRDKNQLYSYESVVDGQESLAQNTYTVNTDGDYAYRYENIVNDISSDFELGLFGTYLKGIGWDTKSMIDCMNSIVSYGHLFGEFQYASMGEYFGANGWIDKDGNLDFDAYRTCMEGKIRVRMQEESPSFGK